MLSKIDGRISIYMNKKCDCLKEVLQTNRNYYELFFEIIKNNILIIGLGDLFLLIMKLKYYCFI